jgi:hypothetical protein
MPALLSVALIVALYALAVDTRPTVDVITSPQRVIQLVVGAKWVLLAGMAPVEVFDRWGCARRPVRFHAGTRGLGA